MTGQVKVLGTLTLNEPAVRVNPYPSSFSFELALRADVAFLSALSTHGIEVSFSQLVFLSFNETGLKVMEKPPSVLPVLRRWREAELGVPTITSYPKLPYLFTY